MGASSANSSASLVSIPADGITLDGNLDVPVGASGIVVFVHGSGSSRHSSRNRFVAESLRRGGLATLLFDLLTPEEEAQERFTRHLRFDIDLVPIRITRQSEKRSGHRRSGGRQDSAQASSPSAPGCDESGSSSCGFVPPPSGERACPPPAPAPLPPRPESECGR
jgi:hypothetical protein